MAGISRALIIGCGYLGTRVGALLRARGACVTATTTTRDRFSELSALGFEPAQLDLAAPEDSPVWGEQHDAVVYAVAPGRSGDATVAFRDGPLQSARRLSGASGRPRSFVLISSTGVYAEQGGGWVEEDSPAEPPEDRLRGLREAEDALRDLATRAGFPAVILRLTGIYGPGRSPLQWLRRPEMMARISRSRGDAWMNWVRVEDAAEATILAIERGRPGETYIVSDGEPVRRADFYGFAARAAGLEVPAFTGNEGDLGKRCSAQKARRELGFAPRYPSYREGLSDLAGGQAQAST